MWVEGIDVGNGSILSVITRSRALMGVVVYGFDVDCRLRIFACRCSVTGRISGCF